MPTAGITIGFNDTNGNTWSKTINELDPEEVTTTNALERATAYKRIVAGDLKSLKHTLTTPIDID